MACKDAIMPFVIQKKLESKEYLIIMGLHRLFKQASIKRE